MNEECFVAADVAYLHTQRALIAHDVALPELLRFMPLMIMRLGLCERSPPVNREPLFILKLIFGTLYNI